MSQGVGIKFDNVRTVDLKAVGIVKSDKVLIAESIHRIINTSFGERPRNFGFGCDIKKVLFDQNDFTTNALGSYYVSESIERLEPRVKVESIYTQRSNSNENKLIVSVVFTIVQDPNELLLVNVEV